MRDLKLIDSDQEEMSCIPWKNSGMHSGKGGRTRRDKIWRSSGGHAKKVVAGYLA